MRYLTYKMSESSWRSGLVCSAICFQCFIFIQILSVNCSRMPLWRWRLSICSKATFLPRSSSPLWLEPTYFPAASFLHANASASSRPKAMNTVGTRSATRYFEMCAAVRSTHRRCRSTLTWQMVNRLVGLPENSCNSSPDLRVSFHVLGNGTNWDRIMWTIFTTNSSFKFTWDATRFFPYVCIL